MPFKSHEFYWLMACNMFQKQRIGQCAFLRRFVSLLRRLLPQKSGRVAKVLETRQNRVNRIVEFCIVCLIKPRVCTQLYVDFRL